MNLEEPTLLHEPDLMLAVLRIAAVGSGTLDDCFEHLRQLRRYAQVDEPMPESDVRGRLEAVQAKLRLAGLIEVGSSGRCRITAFGRRILADHPGGVDDSVLMQLRKPPRLNGHRAGREPPARMPSIDYQRGYEAFIAGANLADNPFPGDVRAYLDWENGWSQARDDAIN
jgi:restriction system protein